MSQTRKSMARENREFPTFAKQFVAGVLDISVVLGKSEGVLSNVKGNADRETTLQANKEFPPLQVVIGCRFYRDAFDTGSALWKRGLFSLCRAEVVFFPSTRRKGRYRYPSIKAASGRSCIFAPYCNFP